MLTNCRSLQAWCYTAFRIESSWLSVPSRIRYPSSSLRLQNRTTLTGHFSSHLSFWWLWAPISNSMSQICMSCRLCHVANNPSLVVYSKLSLGSAAPSGSVSQPQFSMRYRIIQAHQDIMPVIPSNRTLPHSGLHLVLEQRARCSYLGLRLVLKVTIKKSKRKKLKHGKADH